MLDIEDLMQTQDGRGVINVLAADKLMNSPRLYGCFLLWLLAELFEQLPEAGDLPKPKLAFFFDEAHLLFNDAPPALLEKVEQVVRLIRSKGVGVYFVTQNPLDIPDTVLGQLGNRVQHALRAFTPRDQKAVKAAADTLRANPAFDAAGVITELGVGEALVSFLDDHGRPTVVERGFVLPPVSRIGPTDSRGTPCRHRRDLRSPATTKRRSIANPPTKSCKGDANQKVGAGDTCGSGPCGRHGARRRRPSGGGLLGGFGDMLFGSMLGGAAAQRDAPGARPWSRPRYRAPCVRSARRGREIVRGVLGSIMGGRRR
jgi:hypothetical protein